MKNPFVSVIIPTYKRSFTISYVLANLEKQTYKDFEVIIVAKKPTQKVEIILKEFSERLVLKRIVQREGFAPEAYDLGLKTAKGEIIAFLDDDAIPDLNWLKEHVETYIRNERIGGVTGTDILVRISKRGYIENLAETQVDSFTENLCEIKHRYLYHPIKGMEGWLVYFAKDGLSHHNPKFLFKKKLKKQLPSLLFLGANMSVRRKAVDNIKLSEFLTVTSFLYEPLLSYQIWRKGYRTVYNPKPKVFHVIEEESLGRFFKKPINAAIRDAEYVLSFFTLKKYEKEVSWISYSIEIVLLIASRFLGARKYGIRVSIYRVFGLLYGFIIGMLGDKSSIRNSLRKIFSH